MTPRAGPALISMLIDHNKASAKKGQSRWSRDTGCSLASQAGNTDLLLYPFLKDT